MKQKVINRGLCTSHFTKKNHDKQNGNYGLNRIFSGLKTVIFVFGGSLQESKNVGNQSIFLTDFS